MATATLTPLSVYNEMTLYGVDWETYLKHRDEPANALIRMTYLDGTLILMSPRLIHDRPIHHFEIFIQILTFVWRIEVVGARSTTLRRAGTTPDQGSAKEPDTAYYIGANEQRIRPKKDIDLAIDPPPDLAIEVDNTHNSELALPTYARIGVPEVWRYHVAERSLWFGRLTDGGYESVERSGILPKLTPSLVMEALDMLDEGQMGENGWLRWLMDWARELPDPPPTA